MSMEAIKRGELLTPELISELKRLVLYSRRRINSDLLGEYKSAFKGQGLTFREQREYAAGDEIRHINWKSSARSDKVFVKTYEEDRRANVVVLADFSSSTNFGRGKTKHRQILEYTALLSLLALQSGDSAGICLFSEDVEKYLRPSARKGQLQRILVELMAERKLQRRTNMGSALQFLNQHLPAHGIVFILSDFYSQEPFEEQLQRLALRHDVISICLVDRAEYDLPDCGIISFQDAESGRVCTIDTSNKKLMSELQGRLRLRHQMLSELFQRTGTEQLFIEGDFLHQLSLLMQQRRRRISR